MFVEFVLRIQIVQDVHSALQGINAGIWNGGVRHFAVNSHFHLQATVVGCDDLIAEAGRNHQVGFCVTFFEQPAGAFFAAELFVVREVQFNIAFEF